MAGEELAFRRTSVGIPVSEVSRHIDRDRLYLDWPIGQNQTVISSYSPESLGTEMGVYATIHTTAAWPAANRAIFVPFVVYNTLTIVKLGFYNGTVVSGNVDCGIYDASGNRKVSAGSTAQAGTNVIQIFDVTDTVLTMGLYYLAGAIDNTTGTVFRPSSMTDKQMTGACGILSMASAFPLPSTATFAAAADTICPTLFATQRTVI